MYGLLGMYQAEHGSDRDDESINISNVPLPLVFLASLYMSLEFYNIRGQET
jgi:hypothetical protein